MTAEKGLPEARTSATQAGLLAGFPASVNSLIFIAPIFSKNGMPPTKTILEELAELGQIHHITKRRKNVFDTIIVKKSDVLKTITGNTNCQTSGCNLLKLPKRSKRSCDLTYIPST